VCIRHVTLFKMGLFENEKDLFEKCLFGSLAIVSQASVPCRV
jgi:hypothetical protein